LARGHDPDVLLDDPVANTAPHAGSAALQETVPLPAKSEVMPKDALLIADVPSSVEPIAETSSSVDGHLEYRRSGSRTIALNRAHPRQDLVERAAVELAEGPPEAWEQLPHDSNRTSFCCDRPDDGGQPEIFVKTKPYATPEDVAARAAAFEPPDQMALAAQADATHELELAPQVRRIVESERAQEIVRAYGLDSIAYIEPLSVTVDVAAKTQSIAYPWQEGVSTHNLEDMNDNISMGVMEMLHKISAEMRDVFAEHGIVARDLLYRQFIVRENKLLLVDAESYHRRI
jgi:hypothetical protein